MDDSSVILGTGSLGISSTLDFYVSRTHQREFLWRIEGLAEKEISFGWNVGEGEYYWYRVEGECGSVNCENSGVDASGCNKMTFVTVVSARNVAEVCDALNSPRINPPANLRVAFIKRYSRPVLKGSVPDDQCNILEEQEFCHIPECLDYCVDETIAIPAVMSMSSIDFMEFRQMSGGLSLSGSSETNRDRRYNPVFPIVSVSGASACGFSLRAETIGGIVLSGSSPITIDNIVLECLGSIFISGSSRATSPYYYFSPSGLVSLSGSGVSMYPSFKLEHAQQNIILVSGSSESTLLARFFSSGSAQLGGMAGDYVSPSYFYRPSGQFVFGGQAERNFEGLGTIVVDSSMDMGCFDFASDFNDLAYGIGLTISDETVTPLCGCGPLGLSLLMRHNLFGSSVINNFLNKNRQTLPSLILMKYRSSDFSWRFNTNFYGSNESLSILFSIACMTDVWRLTFSARKSTQGLNKNTKFIVDMPSDAICADGSISTRISLGVNPLVVEGIPVVSPAHTSIGNTSQSSAVVDGFIFDYVVYYDEIGIFSDSYWSRTPFDIYIEPPNSPEMPAIDLEKIFP